MNCLDIAHDEEFCYEVYLTAGTGHLDMSCYMAERLYYVRGVSVCFVDVSVL